MREMEKVLLVDDDEIIHFVYQRLFKKSVFAIELHVAKDGHAAMDLLEQFVANGEKPPDLILLDVNMPKMGGFEFLEKYAERRLGQELGKTIIMFSTSLLTSDHDRAIAHSSVFDFVDKCMPSEEFLATLDEFRAAH